MTKEDFASLQELHRSSGLSLLKFLKHEHISYSTYNYWKRKSAYALEQDSEDSGAALVPITIKVPGVIPSEWRDLVIKVEGIQESPQQRLKRLRAERNVYTI